MDSITEDDLYGDLREEDSQEVSYVEIKADLDAVKLEAARLRKENIVLKEQNVALKKNISCLYRTAKLEIERKDNEIRRLNQILEKR
ncbi:protein bicaudal D-like [Oscarella lobularis]|uniref:protein bicaudal D-like n=1 Tax=Oscarella lobularis TaxID=121494 RepID=UPI0033139E80